MTAPRYSFNRDALALFVHVRREIKLGITMTEAAAQIGITKAQLFRASHRQPISNLAFLAICRWMGANPFCFVIDEATGRTLSPLPDATVKHETCGETSEPRQPVSEIVADEVDAWRTAGVEAGCVKIGHAVDPWARLQALQCASSGRLAIIRIVPGGQKVERWFRRRFAHLRVRGEWFTFNDEMLTVVAPDELPRHVLRRPAPPRQSIGEFFRNADKLGLLDARMKRDYAPFLGDRK